MRHPCSTHAMHISTHPPQVALQVQASAPGSSNCLSPSSLDPCCKMHLSSLIVLALTISSSVGVQTVSEPGPEPEPGFPKQWLPFWDLLPFRSLTSSVHAVPLDVLDMFAGPKFMLTRSCVEHGLNAISMEKLNDSLMENVLTAEGQQFFLQALRRMPRGALLWMGPPCNSWIRCSQSWYHRTEECPESNPSMYPQVIYWNAIADFVAAAILAATTLGIYVVVEQPLNSLMLKYLPCHKTNVFFRNDSQAAPVQHPCTHPNPVSTQGRPSNLGTGRQHLHQQC
jgi:hypothetical protein